MFWISDSTVSFPPVEAADEDGLLAIGGSLNTERVLQAYRLGIFPWYNENEPPCWWSPDPRFVLFPEALKISKSMKPLLNRSAFKFTVNRAFAQVLSNCRDQPRHGQTGTWINPDIVATYNRLHEMGYGHSAEAWLDGELVGGLYGIRLGNVFFGESMFSKTSNASKYAFIRYVKLLQKEGVVMIDCQVYTEHLQSLGAKMIPRNHFITCLRDAGVRENE